jgi:hypothetical protein
MNVLRLSQPWLCTRLGWGETFAHCIRQFIHEPDITFPPVLAHAEAAPSNIVWQRFLGESNANSHHDQEKDRPKPHQ